MNRLAISLATIFSAALVSAAAAQSMAPETPAGRQVRTVAVTFDDLPATGGTGDLARLKYITGQLLEKLKEERVPAIGFVNESKLIVRGEIDARSGLLEDWLANGHQLGNHTFSHIAIDSASIDQYKEDVIRGETITKMLLAERGQPLRYFRHTQLRTGPDEAYRVGLAEFLRSRGYIEAPVTIDNNEYIFAAIYERAKSRSDADGMKKIVDSYVVYMETVIEHFENLSREFLGYDVSQILLLHANELNADHFDKIAQMMRLRGYRFVTLEEALKDKAYELPEAGSRRGLSWIHRWMLADGKSIREEPGVPDWINDLFRNRR